MTDAYVTPAQIQSIWRAKAFTAPTASVSEKIITQKYFSFTGDGYIAGEAPSGGSQDGRTRINGALASVRVVLFERRGNGFPLYVTETRSASDGTWRIDYLDRTKIYFVLGLDQDAVVSLAGQDHVIPVAM